MGREEKMQKKESSEHSSTEDLIRRWLVKLAAMYNYEVPAALFAIWVEIFEHLPAKALDGAFRNIQATFQPTSACPFPVPAHLADSFRAHKNFAVEGAWQEVLEELLCWSPDIPNRSANALPSRVQYAVRAAGGWHALYNANPETLPFRKRDFIAAYDSYGELEAQGLISEQSPVIKELADAMKSLGEKKKLR